VATATLPAQAERALSSWIVSDRTDPDLSVFLLPTLYVWMARPTDQLPGTEEAAGE
jgi:hypothetical protein